MQQDEHTNTPFQYIDILINPIAHTNSTPFPRVAQSIVIHKQGIQIQPIFIPIQWSTAIQTTHKHHFKYIDTPQMQFKQSIQIKCHIFCPCNISKNRVSSFPPF